MWYAALWGGIAGTSVFLGALIGIYFSIPKKYVGYIMAFGTGILLGAASFELLNQSMELGGIIVTTISFILGALLFTVVDIIIANKGGKERKRAKESPVNHSGMAIFVGTIIDAIPESVIIGVSLIGQGGVNLLLVIAIFISNFPEGLSSSIGLKKDGYSKSTILLLWSTVVILAVLSSLLGYSLLSNASSSLIAGISAFAAGGIVSMVSSTMMPEAYEEGGPAIGFIAAIGLITSLILNHFE